jgi:NRAMP (natural resistance-associated macrophage protein)-like metal ion transporter
VHPSLKSTSIKSITRRTGVRDTRSPVVGPSKPRLWQVLGPGLITGAADDDPSGIATYSQAGAQFGLQLCWTLVLTYPLMVVIQAISARIGRTTGRGIAGNIRNHYANWVLQGTVALLFIANTFNIGADLGAMAEATRLIVPRAPAWLLMILFSAICSAGQIYFSHTRYVSVLKYLTLSLLSYFAVLCAVHVAWTDFLTSLVWPRLSMDRELWLTVVAVLGTTISPYLFFWQAAQEVEDTKAEPRAEPLRHHPEQGSGALSRIQLDTVVGMAVSNLVALAIVVTTASTLHLHNVRDIGTAAQAADALKPLAGRFAFALFALGIIGTGLLSVPVLAGSAAYALGESRRWPVGLSRQPMQAKGFYAAIVAATLIGAALNVLAISPIKALVASAVLNAMVSVPVMAILMRIATSHRIMGEFKVPAGWAVWGWAATAIMALASLFFLLSVIPR